MRLLPVIFLAVLTLACDSPDTSEEISVDVLTLPQRSGSALTGASVANAVAGLSLEDREARIYAEVSSGNVPSYLRQFVAVTFSREVAGTTYSVALNVLPDYLAVGSDSTALRIPISPVTAQRIANLTNTSLPTPLIVDKIWGTADVQVAPSPIPPSPEMTTVPVFVNHNETVKGQLEQAGAVPGRLVAGHKKDVVLTSVLDNTNSKVAIYGWHQLDGSPIQPLYTGHTERWVDYSHGIRLIDRTVTIDGESFDIVDVLSDPEMSLILTNNGPIASPYYATSFTSAPLE